VTAVSDDEARTVFHRAAGRPDEGPPLGIDVADVMTRGRRIRTRRAALAAAGGTLAVVAAVTVGLTSTRDVTPPTIVRPADPPSLTGNPPSCFPGGSGTCTPAPMQPPAAPDVSRGEPDQPTAPAHDAPRGGGPAASPGSP
jgi:hypothetical protein